MKILILENNLALYFGVVESINDSCVTLVSGAVNASYNTSNSHIIDVEPPVPTVPFAWKRAGDVWEVADQSLIDEYNAQIVAKHNEDAKAARAAAYKDTDPLFFKAQRGEITMQEWLDAVQAVKDKYPYI